MVSILRTCIKNTGGLDEMWISKGLLKLLLNKAETEAYDKGYANGLLDNQRDILRILDQNPIQPGKDVDMPKVQSDILNESKERLFCRYMTGLNQRPYLSDELEKELKNEKVI